MAREHNIEKLPKWARKQLKAAQQRIADLGRLELLLLDDSKVFAAFEAAIRQSIGYGSPAAEVIAAIHEGKKIRSAIRARLMATTEPNTEAA